MWFAWQINLSVEDNHKIAMMNFAKSEHWFGEWTMAVLPSSSKFEFCFVPQEFRHMERRAILVEFGACHVAS